MIEPAASSCELQRHAEARLESRFSHPWHAVAGSERNFRNHRGNPTGAKEAVPGTSKLGERRAGPDLAEVTPLHEATMNMLHYYVSSALIMWRADSSVYRSKLMGSPETNQMNGTALTLNAREGSPS